jgi:hypothetical protein
MKRVKLEE